MDFKNTKAITLKVGNQYGFVFTAAETAIDTGDVWIKQFDRVNAL